MFNSCITMPRIDKLTSRLCERLLLEGRKAYLCKKTETASILEYQASRGCKATGIILEKCAYQETSNAQA